MLIARVVMSVVMIIAIMTVVPVLRGTCDVNVSPSVVSRLMRSHPVRVSKSIAHKKKWYQQNRYEPVHSSDPICSNLVRKRQFVQEITRLTLILDYPAAKFATLGLLVRQINGQKRMSCQADNS